MDALLTQARASVRAYLAAIEGQDFVKFAQAYNQASAACATAGLTLAQLRLELTKGGAK